MALQHLRSGTAHKRPIPSVMSAGQLAINTNEASPGLFFKDSNGDLVKVGPVHIGTDAPNSSPASVAATALVTGTVYQILTVGTSDFTLVGASANTVGTVFTATGTTTGDGTVSGQQGVEKGEQWLDTTGGNYVLKIYDGTAWRSEAGEFVNVTGDTMTGDLVMNNANIVFEGATADDFETTLTVTDPTADRTITLPNVTGTVVTTGDTGSVTSTMITNGTIVDADINASAEIAVSKLANGTARQLLQTDAAGTGVEFTSNVDVPGTLDVTGVAVFDSNVGVGTSSISSGEKLKVAAASSGATSVNGLNGLTVESNADTGISILTGNANIGSLAFGDPDNGAIGRIRYLHGSNSLMFQTNGSEKARIDSSGNVGIRTSSPEGYLEISGISETGVPTLYLNRNANVSTTSDIALTGSSVIRSENSIRSVVNTGGFFTWSIGGSDIKAGLTDASEKMRIDSSGNVGIGTSSPSHELHIASTSPTIQLDDTDNNYTAQITQSGAGLFIDSDATNAGGGSLRFRVAGKSEKMRIDSSGNVGIGTSSPSSPLEVAGTVRASNFTGQVATTAMTFGLVGTDTAVVMYGTGASPASTMLFRTGTSEKMRIDSSGNVGIGTSSPSSTLDVNGSLSKNSGSFKIDHPLPSLTETHHLVHSFVEAPDASNLYAGMIDLVDGTATVNIDTAHRMTEGTFEALNTVQSWSTSNESGYAPVKSSLSGNLLTIQCQDATSNDTVYYEVRGIRKDQHMIETEWTDENGRVITEPLKQPLTDAGL